MDCTRSLVLPLARKDSRLRHIMPRRKKDNIVTEIPVSANQLNRSIIEYLTLRGCKAWRNNTGAVRPQRSNGSYGFIRFGEVGSGDVLFIMPPFGRFGSIETKTQNDRLRKTQEDWMETVNNLGGIAFVARSLDDVLERMEKEFVPA